LVTHPKTRLRGRCFLQSHTVSLINFIAGFKFDESEAQAATEKKKYQKAALGLQDSDDEDVEGDLDQQIETMLAAKKIVKEIKVSRF
jgi:hypothetical protein